MKRLAYWNWKLHNFKALRHAKKAAAYKAREQAFSAHLAAIKQPEIIHGPLGQIGPNDARTV